MLEIVRSSADTLIRIVNDVLDFAKISTGKLKFEETDFDLVTIVEGVIALFDAEARHKHIEIASTIDEESPRHCAATRHGYARF
jgi:polar amino acid transport system substrate-binding protein/two-component system sensor histidine kinase/response regulator